MELNKGISWTRKQTKIQKLTEIKSGKITDSPPATNANFHVILRSLVSTFGYCLHILISPLYF